MIRATSLVATLAFLLPSAAWADCQDRIAAVENHPAILQQDEAVAGPPDDTVQEDGGETQHADGGPATPSESWFTNASNDDKGTVLTHLDAARAAHQAGDEAACLDAVEQAEAALEKG